MHPLPLPKGEDEEESPDTARPGQEETDPKNPSSAEHPAGRESPAAGSTESDEAGVACSPVFEGDLHKAPGCERIHLCASGRGYALVLQAGEQLISARTSPLGAERFSVAGTRVAQGREAMVWRVEERGLTPSHTVTREEVLLPVGNKLTQVFGRVHASTVHQDAATPTKRVLWCRTDGEDLLCGNERFVFDEELLEYVPAPPPGKEPYRSQRLPLRGVTVLDAWHAVLHAAAKEHLRPERRGLACVEAQQSFELFSAWPERSPATRGAPGSTREARTEHEGARAWRVFVTPDEVRVEALPFVSDEAGAPHPRFVPKGYAYPFERSFLQSVADALARKVTGPPAGLETFRCDAGFGVPLADIALGASFESVFQREKRWHRRCNMSLGALRRAAKKKPRLVCASSDGVVRSYDFERGRLVAVGERYPARVARRHLGRARERFTARFGTPVATDATSRASAAWIWHWQGRELRALTLPGGDALFVHRLVEGPTTKAPPFTPPPATLGKHPTPRKRPRR